MKSLHRSARLARYALQRTKPTRLTQRRHLVQPRVAQLQQQTDIKRRLETACIAVRRAGRLCREVQSELKGSEKMGKSDDSPVTVADFGAQAIVAYTLDQARLPGDLPISLVAEEAAAAIKTDSHKEMRRRIVQLVNRFIPTDAVKLTETDVLDLIDLGLSEGGSSGLHWVLDPIDGTRGFVSKRQYAICLGLLSEGDAVVGVLGCPNMPRRKIIHEDGQPGGCIHEERTHAARNLEEQGDDVGCLFIGTKGVGAFVGSLWSQDLPHERISVDTETSMEEIRFMESIESRHSNQEITQQLAKLLGIRKPPLRLDSQAKYGALSRGDASLFMRFPPNGYKEKIWDHCAGSVIVEAGGGKISDVCGNCLDFSQGRFLHIDDGIIAATPVVHSAFVSLYLSRRMNGSLE